MRQKFKESFYCLECGSDGDHLVDEIFDDLDKVYIYRLDMFTNVKYTTEGKLSVYRVSYEDNKIILIGSKLVDTRAYLGSKAIAALILSEKLGYEMSEDKSSLVNSSIVLIEFP